MFIDNQRNLPSSPTLLIHPHCGCLQCQVISNRNRMKEQIHTHLHIHTLVYDKIYLTWVNLKCIRSQRVIKFQLNYIGYNYKTKNQPANPELSRRPNKIFYFFIKYITKLLLLIYYSCLIMLNYCFSFRTEYNY